MLYQIFRFGFRILFRYGLRWIVIGKEHVPNEGAVVVCCNHRSNLDPPLVGSPMQRQVFFMAKEELFKIPLISSLIRRFGAFPVRRGVNDKQAIKHTLHLLRENNILAIFPEGTRSLDGRLGKGHTGAAMFALKTNATVIPAAIIGSYRPFGRIKVVYGPPVDLSSFKGVPLSGEIAQDATNQIMNSIQNLLDSYGNS
jgi:1-acyl-sn-glycerol-3-phosphate acyltransferase